MAETSFNIASLITTNRITANNRPQEIEAEHFSQDLRLDFTHGDAASDASDASDAITQRLKIKVSGLEISTSQVNDVISMLETVAGSSHEILLALNGMKKLAVQAATGPLSVTDREALDLEFGKLFAEIQSIATEPSWNNMTLMSGSDQGAEAHVTAALAAESLSMPLAKVDGQTMSINLKAWDPSTTIRTNAVQQVVDPMTGLHRVSGNQFTSNGLVDGGDGSPRRLNILSKINAEYVLANIDKAISATSDERDRLNAYISSLENAGEKNQSHNRIDDADYAVEVLEVSRTKIIAQAGAGMSAQANAGYENVLNFLMQ